jgi:hypothetical protein
MQQTNNLRRCNPLIKSEGGAAMKTSIIQSLSAALFASVFTVITITAIGPSIALAKSDEIPTLDVRPMCRGIALQAADPGVRGQGGQADVLQRCIESEKEVHEQLKKRWGEFSAADKRHCVTLAKTGGEPSNTELLTCLEMARDVRVLRSAAAAPKPASSLSTPTPPATSTEAAAPKPASSLSTPTPPATSTEAAAPVVPPASRGRSSVPATERDLDQAKGEAERAKADAEVAKASEALAQRKLADAEAALRRVSEEVKQSKAEAERAKADAQGARESEAALKRKLADAETARVAAEEKARKSGHTTGPGLGGRLRRWFGRPSAPNP